MFFKDLKSYKEGIQKEWILTNGLGGYASSTIIEANSRKYHGLLVAALNPPVDRKVLLSGIDMEVEIDSKIHRLGVHKYPNTVYPRGFEYLETFELEPIPTWNYMVDGLEIKEQVFMIHGQNTTIISYELKNIQKEKNDIFIRLYPLVNMRGFHQTVRSNDINIEQHPKENGTKIESGGIQLFLKSNSRYHPQSIWNYNIEYDIERLRRQDYQEDAHNPGYFEMKMAGVQKIFVSASTSYIEPRMSEIEELHSREIQRIEHLERNSGLEDTFALKLTRAADSFIVERSSTGTRTVIAGYHWFSDWGRDTMISLPGLTLVTRRFDDAAQMISTFANYCKDGLIPNRFPDISMQEPEYNTSDASLWFIHSVGRYFEYTGDTEFISNIWSTIEDIIRGYMNGTHFNIRMEPDSLVSHSGQLTWMDVKINNIEITPRSGKACEINALWYNALETAAHLADNIEKDPTEYNSMAENVKQSYHKTFWNQDEKCLFDCITPEGIPDSSIRPNQIFAVSLPYTMLSRTMEKDIVRRVEEELLTPMGLRTLSPKDNEYKSHYHGDSWTRDNAYHNGTVWPWLMGPYISAYTKINDYSKKSREDASSLIKG